MCRNILIDGEVVSNDGPSLSALTPGLQTHDSVTNPSDMTFMVKLLVNQLTWCKPCFWGRRYATVAKIRAVCKWATYTFYRSWSTVIMPLSKNKAKAGPRCHYINKVELNWISSAILQFVYNRNRSSADRTFRVESQYITQASGHISLRKFASNPRGVWSVCVCIV